MKNILNLSSVFIALLFISCSNGQTPGSKLPANDFQKKIKELPSAPIIDVRTPEEFEEGHLSNAQNINWNDDNFESEINKLDKNQAVFVYCRSGGRSAAAVKKMDSLGFKNIYELEGGIKEWESEKLPTISK